MEVGCVIVKKVGKVLNVMYQKATAVWQIVPATVNALGGLAGVNQDGKEKLAKSQTAKILPVPTTVHVYRVSATAKPVGKAIDAAS